MFQNTTCFAFPDSMFNVSLWRVASGMYWKGRYTTLILGGGRTITFSQSIFSAF